MPPEHKPGLINQGWVAWERVSDVERPETPEDPSVTSLMMCSGASLRCILPIT